MAQAFAPIEQTWVSEATVVDKDGVAFDEDFGPLVTVTMQPSNVRVQCRTLMQSAGKGEGEWVPFVAGDHVLIALPEGSVRTSPIILGRLSNSLDKFPMTSVAGQDPTKNNFAFKRTRTPWTHEIAGTYTVREATSGAFLSITKEGNITLRDGTKAALQMSPDAFSYLDGSGKVAIQANLSGHVMTLQMEEAMLQLSGAQATPNASAIVTPGPLAVSANAQPPAEHVITTEAVVHLMAQVLIALGATGVGPITGASLVVPGAAEGIVAAAIAKAAVQPMLPVLAGPLALLWAAAQQKPPGTPALGQTFPGLGCAGFLAG